MITGNLDMPPMRDRLTMARSIRGYVVGRKYRTGTGSLLGGAGSATARERKALVTMGHTTLERLQQQLR